MNCCEELGVVLSSGSSNYVLSLMRLFGEKGHEGIQLVEIVEKGHENTCSNCFSIVINEVEYGFCSNPAIINRAKKVQGGLGISSMVFELEEAVVSFMRAKHNIDINQLLQKNEECDCEIEYLLNEVEESVVKKELQAKCRINVTEHMCRIKKPGSCAAKCSFFHRLDNDLFCSKKQVVLKFHFSEKKEKTNTVILF
ncbi:MAG: hypothetical protein GY754_12045 [bacterium]|nr:hypothetical protein [bacterium]